MATYGFSENDAKRIGKSVRLAERFPPKLDHSVPGDSKATPGVRLMVGQILGTVEPLETAQFLIRSGENLNQTAYTVIARNSLYPLVDTAATVYVGNNGFGWHVVEGVQQAWCGVIEEPWPIGEERTIVLHGPEIEVTAINEVAPIHCESGAEVVVAYTDDKWRVVNSETYHTRPGTYDASTKWLNGESKVVTFGCGDTATVRNDVASVPLWTSTRDCVAAYEYGQWSLVNAESYYTRRGTYDASTEWANGGSKTVTLVNGGEVTALNHSANVPLWTSTRDCVVSYEHDQWSLVAAETYYVRRGTFSGTWAKNATKTVTLTDGGSVTADNLFGDVGVSGQTKNCAVAYEGGDWFLIAAECA